MEQPVFNYTAHKELWDWLSKNTEKDKYYWTGWSWNGGKYDFVDCYCFACEYDMYFHKTIVDDCKNCPLDCSNIYCKYNRCLNGLFDGWEKAKTSQDRIKYAELIRDLPVREGIRCI